MTGMDADPASGFDPLAEGRQLLDDKNHELMAAFSSVLRLMGERAQIIEDHIAPAKRQHGLPILQPERRDELLAAIEEEALKHGVEPGEARALWTVLHDLGVARQQSS